MGGSRSAGVDFETLQRFLGQLKDALNRLDAPAVASLFDADVVIEDVNPARRVRGRHLLEELLAGVFSIMSQMSFEMVGQSLLSSDGRLGAARWHITGMTAGNQSVDYETVDFYEFEHGSIVGYTIFVRDPDWLGRTIP